MGASGDAADQVVKVTLDGVDMILRLAGDGAKDLAALLIAESKKPKRTKGKASLAQMLKQKTPIKVFEIDDKSLKKFCEEAKKYGVLYHVLKNTDPKNHYCDILVREEDLDKVNRIIERNKLGRNNQDKVRSSVEKAKQKTKPVTVSVTESKPVPKRTVPDKSPEDAFIEELFRKPSQTEKNAVENPQVTKTGISPPSESLSRAKDTPKTKAQSGETVTGKKEPVRKQIEKYRAEIQKEKSATPDITKTINNKRSKDYGRT